MNRVTFLRLSVCAFLCCATMGCVERQINLRSDPPGACAYIDGKEVGETPCSFSFTFYGTREFMLEKEGYERAVWKEDLNAPWYEVFPIDFFSEILWPSVFRDERTIEHTLTKAKPVDKKKLLERATDFRERAMEP